MTNPVASVRSVSDYVDAVKGTFTNRECIVALARRCADLLSLPQPSTFGSDPETPAPLGDLVGKLSIGQCTVDHLGTAWEQLLAVSDRRTHGAHFTPRRVADRVAELALTQRGAAIDDANSETRGPTKELRIWDPSCGGGAFLLAAARWLDVHTDHDRGSVVGAMYASDIDSTAVSVCDAALELWCGGSARPTTAVGDALLDLPPDWPADLDVVVGNPPFLGQLTSDTTRSADRRARLAAKYQSAAGAYVDEAGLFVELAVRHVAPDGVTALVVPESMLGASDAEAMRNAVTEDAHLCGLWIDDGQSFEAAVDVVAVILQRSLGAGSHSTNVTTGVESPFVLTTTATPSASSWAPLLARALGVPSVRLLGTQTLGDLAVVTAGFRQHFYGIADAVAEAEPEHAIDVRPKLITSGAIEPLRSLWSQKQVRFAGHRWTAPVLELAKVDDEQVRDWFTARCVPKLLLASQTKVVEAIVDTHGTFVPSVPVISVEPSDPSTLWHIAAALCAPAISAWMLTEAAGTGLSHDAIRLRAKTLAQVPMPTNQQHWDQGAAFAQQAHEAGDTGDMTGHRAALGDLAVSMNAAYGVEEYVASWWWERLRLPPGSPTTHS